METTFDELKRQALAGDLKVFARKNFNIEPTLHLR